MNFGANNELHQAMKKHLQAGITPGQFGMDALRVDELRLPQLPPELENVSAPSSDFSQKSFSASIVGWMSPVVARLRSGLVGLIQVRRVRT